MITTRLVPEPIFILSCIRSGSTLLRCMLGTHRRLYAPHELHLTGLRVDLDSPYAATAMDAAGLDNEQLEYILWDRVLHELLCASGKDMIVEKTPGNAGAWRRLVACWPRARFVFLLRDPADILASAIAVRSGRDPIEVAEIVTDLVEGVQEACMTLTGHEIHYEDLVAEPQAALAGLCEFLGVAYLPSMLAYDVPSVLRPGIGDFTDKIRSGKVMAERIGSPPVTGRLAEYRRLWGYTDA